MPLEAPTTITTRAASMSSHSRGEDHLMHPSAFFWNIIS